MKQKEYVILVDENDNKVGEEEKMAAHRSGLLHRGFSIFLFRNKNNRVEQLLQQRAINKYHCGGLWTNACCSHPRSGMDMPDAGKIRLKEEMGIETSLVYVCSFHYHAKFSNGLIENEIDHVLMGYFDSDYIPFNPHEVKAVRWISLIQLEKEYFEKPNSFTPWFRTALLLTKQQGLKRILFFP